MIPSTKNLFKLIAISGLCTGVLFGMDRNTTPEELIIQSISESDFAAAHAIINSLNDGTQTPEEIIGFLDLDDETKAILISTVADAAQPEVAPIQPVQEAVHPTAGPAEPEEYGTYAPGFRANPLSEDDIIVKGIRDLVKKENYESALKLLNGNNQAAKSNPALAELAVKLPAQARYFVLLKLDEAVQANKKAPVDRAYFDVLVRTAEQIGPDLVTMVETTRTQCTAQKVKPANDEQDKGKEPAQYLDESTIDRLFAQARVEQNVTERNVILNFIAQNTPDGSALQQRALRLMKSSLLK